MKVLIHTYDTAFQNKAGGVHNRILNTVKELREQGIQVDFFNKYETAIDEYDILHIFKLDSGTRQLVDYARSVGVKVIISSIVSLEKGRLIDCYWNIRKLPLSTIYKQLFHICEVIDGMIVETPKEADFMEKHFHIPRKKICIIPNGAEYIDDFDDSVYEVIGKKCKYAVVIGRFDNNKNQINVIKALKNTDIDIVFAGGPDPSRRLYYESCLKEADKRENIHFLGWLEQNGSLLKSVLGNASVIICPSFQETFGLSIIEGIIAGAMPIVSNTLPILEFESLKKIKTFNPNDVEDIREKIISGIKEKVDCNLKTVVADEFSWGAVASQHLEVYSKIL